MNRLTQFRLCPFSRGIRLALAEYGLEAELIEERAWEYRQQFLALNPSGDLPVLQLDNGATVFGSYAISEYLAEAIGPRRPEPRGIDLFPGGADDRAEVRRLVDWFHSKFDREVTRELTYEKVISRFQAAGGPNPEVLRAVRNNLRYHMSYVEHLSAQRRWIGGEDPSFADLACAAHLSIVDYLGEVAWDDYPSARGWYAKVKSRPSFRSLLADRVPGVPVSPHYADLDF